MKTTNTRAIVRHHPNYIAVLCHRGHLIEYRKLGRDFAGSAFEAELGAHAASQANRFDRLSEKCCPIPGGQP